jgi:hypothetical protein
MILIRTTQPPAQPETPAAVTDEQPVPAGPDVPPADAGG